MTSDADVFKAALRYAARGLSVVPLHTPQAEGCSCAKGPGCASAGKHPRLDWRPYQERRATSEEIGSWWARWPRANVGIITGMISRLCVLDIDPRNGGFETLFELDSRGFVVPDDTPLVETGALGLHHYFGLETLLPKAAPFEGIEVQAEGALVVAPPSLHRSWRRYRWLRPLESSWPAVPKWVRRTVERAEAAPTAGAMAPLPDADRDDLLGGLHAAGVYLGRHRRKGLHRIRCPWAVEHSNEDPEAVVIEPGASTAPGWAFVCLHSHCVQRHVGALLDWLAIPRRRAS